MQTALKDRGRRHEPTDEEFVNAVIHSHERIRANLQALLNREAHSRAGATAEDTEVIRAYYHAHGIDTITETRRAEPRWLAV